MLRVVRGVLYHCTKIIGVSLLCVCVRVCFKCKQAYFSLLQFQSTLCSHKAVLHLQHANFLLFPRERHICLFHLLHYAVLMMLRKKCAHYTCGMWCVCACEILDANLALSKCLDTSASTHCQRVFALLPPSPLCQGPQQRTPSSTVSLIYCRTFSLRLQWQVCAVMGVTFD